LLGEEAGKVLLLPTRGRGMRVGDLIFVSRAPAVVSLSDVEQVRDALALPGGRGIAYDRAVDLLRGYHLGDKETRAAFEAMIASLGRTEQRGDAFLLQGVCGAGKSHLLAVLALLCGHPNVAWPPFLETHPHYERTSRAFARPRLVVSVPLDEYHGPSHSLEHVVLSRLESELARRHGVRVALTEQSHLLELVQRYVVPQAGAGLDEMCRVAGAAPWRVVHDTDPQRAAEIAVEFIAHTGFPLDWRRSRAEAWGALRAALDAHGIDGPLILLDELGTFLASKTRQSLNADAAFLQYLAQRTAGQRCWLVAVTQRGLEEVGDIDRRTLRQMRGRFRPGFTLDLADLAWVVGHRLVRPRDAASFAEQIARVYDELSAAGELPFTRAELAQSYPVNPLCLRAIQAAAESCLSRTRSVLTLLQEAVHERGWLDLPAGRLVTADVAFEFFQDEIALSVAGRQHLHARRVVMANAGRIAPGREREVEVVVDALVLVGVGGLRWAASDVRGSLVGGEHDALWRRPGGVEDVLVSLRRRGAYVEREVEADGSDGYFLDVSSDASERIRHRLNEVIAGLCPDDSRVAAAALEACGDPSFPLAGLAEPRSVAVEWLNARRHVSAVCRDLSQLSDTDLGNLCSSLESPSTREDGWLFIALPTASAEKQGQAWRDAAASAQGRFAAAMLAWIPRELTSSERAQLVEHAALAQLVNDPTFVGRRDQDLRSRLRQRWGESQSQVCRLLMDAYHQGAIIGPMGEHVMGAERLAAARATWEECLAEAYRSAFARIFPRFCEIAPERRLVGRAHTSQIIDQFIRPGEARLPPASALEAHLGAYARPLGLVEGEGRHPVLALHNSDLVAAAIRATPERSDAADLDPADVVAYGDFAGRLAKSEWGLVREQSELLAAALIRTGKLVALDAFLQPVRLDVVAAPLGDNLPYVARGIALGGDIAAGAQALWTAATGETLSGWDLQRQEKVWADLVCWAGRALESAGASRELILRAADALGHPHAAWSWAERARARAESIARDTDRSLASGRGLETLVAAARRAPGGLSAACEAIDTWRRCQAFFDGDLVGVAALRRLIADQRTRCPDGSQLARARATALDALGSSEGLVADPPAARALAERWLDAYRKHYVAWHDTTWAAGRFEPFAALRGSSEMEVCRRLARVGLPSDETAAIDSQLSAVLELRCLAGDPLPEGHPVCPACGLELTQRVELPDWAALAARVGRARSALFAELLTHSALLVRRLRGCRDARVAESVGALLDRGATLPAEQMQMLLTDDVVAWLRLQLGNPRAERRDLRALAAGLRGRELTKREALRIVEEWLAAGDDEVIEIV